MLQWAYALPNTQTKTCVKSLFPELQAQMVSSKADIKWRLLRSGVQKGKDLLLASTMGLSLVLSESFIYRFQ